MSRILKFSITNNNYDQFLVSAPQSTTSSLDRLIDAFLGRKKHRVYPAGTLGETKMNGNVITEVEEFKNSDGKQQKQLSDTADDNIDKKDTIKSKESIENQKFADVEHSDKILQNEDKGATDSVKTAEEIKPMDYETVQAISNSSKQDDVSKRTTDNKIDLVEIPGLVPHSTPVDSNAQVALDANSTVKNGIATIEPATTNDLEVSPKIDEKNINTEKSKCQINVKLDDNPTQQSDLIEETDAEQSGSKPTTTVIMSINTLPPIKSSSLTTGDEQIERYQDKLRKTQSDGDSKQGKLTNEKSPPTAEELKEALREVK